MRALYSHGWKLVYTIQILKISVFYAIFGHQNGKIPDFKTSVPTLPEFWHMSRQFSQDDVTLM